MKILAIRGKNLASLAGDFALDFQQEPLATAGLFAICGPTGSGKSTLLDALCLALYDDTPRLNGATGRGADLPEAGDETISPRDARNLLRRGAGEGFAEVDFVGNDAIAYRARWSVRRARGKANGRLQNTELSLQMLSSGHPIGGTRTEIAHAIQQRIGLSFSQFTRAVLLAQNEFSTFLKASDQERATLLESLTNLEIYKEISQRAYRRHQEEQNRQADLQARLAEQTPLNQQALTELEKGLATARSTVAALEQRKAQLEQHHQWHERWQTLQQAEHQALETLQQARANQHSAAARQQQLARIEAVQDARPLIAHIGHTTDALARQQHIVLNAEIERDKARHHWQQAEAARLNAEQALQATEQQSAAAAEKLNQARHLDTEIQTLMPGHDAAAKQLTEARQAERDADQQLADQQAHRGQVMQQREATRAWLAEHQNLQALAAEWPRWELLLHDAAALQARLIAIGQSIDTRQQQLHSGQQMLNQARRNRANTEAALHGAEAQWQAAHAAWARFDVDQLAARRRNAETRRDQLAEAGRLQDTLSTRQARQDELNREHCWLQEQARTAAAALARLDVECPVAAARLEQAERSLRTAEAACAETVESLRATLESGSPCPVCGATEHPYALGAAPSHALLASLRAEVLRCRKAQEALTNEQTAQRTRSEHHQQRLAHLADEQVTLAALLEQARTAWNAHPLALEPTTAADPLTVLAAQQQCIKKELEALATDEAAQRQAAKAHDQARQHHAQAQQQQAAAQEAIHTAERAVEATTHHLRHEQERQTELADRLEQRLAELDTACPDPHWRARWQAEPAAFHSIWQQQAAKWNEQHRQLEAWQQQQATLETQISSYNTIRADRALHQQHADRAFQALDEQLQAKRQQRQALLGGNTVAEIEAQLAHNLEHAQHHARQQQTAAHQALAHQARAETAGQHEQKTLVERQQAAEQATEVLQRWLAAFNACHPDWAVEPTELPTLLAHDPMWLKQEQDALHVLTHAFIQAETIFNERREQREGHERQRLSADSAATIQAARQTVLTELAAAQSQMNEAELALRHNQARRQRAGELQGAIARQAHTARIWWQINELIGSASGQKFSTFAQQSTLDVLLGYANCHLADVSRRYRLERIPDTLALMVVDQDMGDERRSVHSLSGGESFLVSLALALGLASLSSSRIRVESLFIDEGFGSLDTDTLRMAMDALDHLQAQGRKVGVISHVQEMTERIGVQIQVQRQSGSQSQVAVRSLWPNR